MTISEQIAPHLPYLRRYARALTGRQTSGDAYVVELLEALIADPAIIRQDLHPRLALYCTFTRLWGSVRLNNAPPVPAEPGQPAVDQRLAELAPLPRQAFLLHTVEDFSLDEVAPSSAPARKRRRRSSRRPTGPFAEQVATNVLIIEDEPIIAMDLEQIVTSLGHRVQAIARTHSQALKAVRENHPGLVLADIQLADGSSGIDAVNDLSGELRGAGDLHYRLSGAPADRRAARAGIPDHQAVPGRHGEGDHQPGAVLRPEVA
jgi:CheY-like chemotaxis protein